MKRFPLPQTSWMTRLGLVLSSVLVVVAGFAIASVVFAALLVVGLVVGGWLWWQYRKLMRKMSAAKPDFIEGEYVIESLPPALEDGRTLSARPADQQNASTPPHTP